MTSFDRVAGAYRWLEHLAFGASLQKARTAHLTSLSDCRRILVVGDGDGRCLEQLLSVAPQARVWAVDTSARMLDIAAARLSPDARARVTFARADIRTFEPGPEEWDAILTMFVLDCLTTDDVGRVARRLVSTLRPGGSWLFADFVIPPHGWRRLRARLWIGLLYRFFRWQTGLDVAGLPDSERELEAAGLVPVGVVDREAGMLRSVRYVRPA